MIGFSLAVFLVFVAAVNWAGIRGSGPVSEFDFSRGALGFSPVGEPAGTIRPKVNTDSGAALEYKYENRVDQFTGVGTLKAQLSGFTGIRVTVWSEKERTLGVVLDEKETGAVYVYTFQAPAGKWVTRDCAPDLFMLSPGSSDTNNLLDAHQLNTRLIIADMSGFEGDAGPNVMRLRSITITREDKTGEEKK